MTKLPPANSPTYKRIIKQGRQGQGPGPAADQDRSVGGAEGERRGREEGGGRAWRDHEQLGSDWNQVFHSAPADMQMNDKQKSMMDEAKASKATMGVGMMAAPLPPMVEYALTKDAGPNIGGPDVQDAAKITVALSDNDRAHDRAHERRHQARHVHLARHGRGNRRAGDASCGGRAARWPARSSTRAASTRSGTWAARCMPSSRWARTRCRRSMRRCPRACAATTPTCATTPSSSRATPASCGR